MLQKHLLDNDKEGSKDYSLGHRRGDASGSPNKTGATRHRLVHADKRPSTCQLTNHHLGQALRVQMVFRDAGELLPHAL